MTRRSSFVNKIVLQLASSFDVASAENDLEIVKDPRKLLCTIQLGSISSSRCQKSRMLLHPEWSMRNRFIFADFIRRTPSDAAPSGGARRDRTDDLMLAKHALSQLSYGPVPEDESDPSDFALRASPDTLRISLAWLRHA